MVESVGKKLNQARVKRGLTIDEAAHATRLRPDKIAALENDDYSRFANNIYAKGFLQIYARFLGVDVSDFARTLDNANPISVSDYQYLSNAPTPRPEQTQVRREERRPPSLAPLFFFILIVGVGAGLLVLQNIRTNAQRLEKSNTSETSPSTEGPASTTPSTPEPQPSSAGTPTPVPAATPAFHTPNSAPAFATNSTTTPLPAPSPATPAPRANSTPSASTPTPGPTPAVAANTSAGSRDQDFVTPTPVSGNDPTTHPLAAGGANEVLVATVKTTWVSVRKDDPKAAPFWEDYVYPNANPLKLKGARFFIEVRGDPNDVQITKNGLPFAYQGANVPVQ